MSDTPETDAFFFRIDIDWDMEVEFARKLERERDDLQKGVNGLCEHLGVNPANTTLLAVEVLKIIRERDEWRKCAKKLAAIVGANESEFHLANDIESSPEKFNQFKNKYERLCN